MTISEGCKRALCAVSKRGCASTLIAFLRLFMSCLIKQGDALPSKASL
jgi:hypothetical protein